MYRYGQYCPISKALEQLGGKWTLLIIRELLNGNARFSELQRSLPKISPALLTKRLKQLETAGVVDREETPENSSGLYRLTEAGIDAEPIVTSLGTWGIRWADRNITPEESDGYILMKDICRNLDVESITTKRCAIQMELLSGAGTELWWLLVNDEGVDLCDYDPGHEIDVYVYARLEPLVDLWFGRRSMGSLRRDNALRVRGKQSLVRSFNRWLARSPLAISK